MDRRRAGPVLRLVGGVLGATLGGGLLVAGVGLAGLGLVMVGEVVGLVGSRLVGSVGVGLASGLVLLAVAWFFVGAAWEGLVGLAPDRGEWGGGVLALAWGGASVAVGLGLGWAGSLAARYGEDLWPGLADGGEVLEITGLVGAVVGPLVAALLWVAERLWPGLARYEGWRVPVVVAVWIPVALVVFTGSRL